MALTQGHQLRRTLVQNIWKVVGAFSFGIVAVVGAGLMLSDVHRIPQGRPLSPTVILDSPQRSETDVQKASNEDSQPLQMDRDTANAVPSPMQQPEEGSGGVVGAELATQNNPAVPSGRKQQSRSTVPKVPNDKGVAENRPPLTAPPVAFVPLIPATVPVGGGGAPGANAAPPADPRLILAPETPIT